MPMETLIRSLLLPELSLIFVRPIRLKRILEVHVEKQPLVEYCPKCATASTSTYDHRTVRVKDEPLRGFQVRLMLRKRRLWCRPCRRPFTEPVSEVIKGRRHTERYAVTCLGSLDQRKLQTCLSSL